jgi:hypothetical protein
MRVFLIGVLIVGTVAAGLGDHAEEVAQLGEEDQLLSYSSDHAFSNVIKAKVYTADEANALWDKTLPGLSAGQQEVRDNKEAKRDAGTRAAATAKVAHEMCAEAFLETKRQCKKMKLASSAAACQKAIKEAGDAIVATVQSRAEIAPSSAVMAKVRKLMLAKTELGEGAYQSGDVASKKVHKTEPDATEATGDPITLESMADRGCQQLLKGVEGLCAKGNMEREFGMDNVKQGMKEYANDVKDLAHEASKMQLDPNFDTPQYDIAKAMKSYASEYTSADSARYAQEADEEEEEEPGDQSA